VRIADPRPELTVGLSRWFRGVNCLHQELRTVSSRYDRERGLLIYFWVCEHCGRRLHEVGRLGYRPNFTPSAAAFRPSEVPPTREWEGGASQPGSHQSPP